MKKWGKIGSPKSAKRSKYLRSIRPKSRARYVSKKTRRNAMRTFGKRLGQSKRYGKGTYVKAGRVHRYSHTRDARRRSKHTRRLGSAAWRGDLKGSRI